MITQQDFVKNRINNNTTKQFQVNNEDAINFYRNFGFDVVETKENYYKRIEPPDAYVLEKKLDGGATTNGTTVAST